MIQNHPQTIMIAHGPLVVTATQEVVGVVEIPEEGPAAGGKIFLLKNRNKY